MGPVTATILRIRVCGPTPISGNMWWLAFGKPTVDTNMFCPFSVTIVSVGETADGGRDEKISLW
jgi:hypothetical protein